MNVTSVELAILTFAGKDATEEFNMIRPLQIRRFDGALPPDHGSLRSAHKAPAARGTDPDLGRKERNQTCA